MPVSDLLRFWHQILMCVWSRYVLQKYCGSETVLVQVWISLSFISCFFQPISVASPSSFPSLLLWSKFRVFIFFYFFTLTRCIIVIIVNLLKQWQTNTDMTWLLFLFSPRVCPSFLHTGFTLSGLVPSSWTSNYKNNFFHRVTCTLTCLDACFKLITTIGL